jgi:AraC family transcriptional regulator
MFLITKVACCSAYYFQRMFSFITDVALSEYIRRRRLTLAAFEELWEIRNVDLSLRWFEAPPVQRLRGALPHLLFSIA